MSRKCVAADHTTSSPSLPTSSVCGSQKLINAQNLVKSSEIQVSNCTTGVTCGRSAPDVGDNKILQPKNSCLVLAVTHA